MDMSILYSIYTDSSIIKTWELLQIVASFLLAGGVAITSCSSSIDCPAKSSGRFVPPGFVLFDMRFDAAAALCRADIHSLVINVWLWASHHAAAVQQ